MNISGWLQIFRIVVSFLDEVANVLEGVEPKPAVTTAGKKKAAVADKVGPVQ